MDEDIFFVLVFKKVENRCLENVFEGWMVREEVLFS